MVRDEPASNNDGANSFPNDNNNNDFFKFKQVKQMPMIQKMLK